MEMKATLKRSRPCGYLEFEGVRPQSEMLAFTEERI